MEKKKRIVFGTAAGIGAIVTTILSGVYEREGGWVHSKYDSGGETNFGVTKRVAVENGFTKSMKDFTKACYSEKDICADKIYYEKYIVAPGYVPVLMSSEAVGEELIDTGINMGPSRPNRWLQEAVNELCAPKGFTVKIAVDGKLGSGTLSAFNTCQEKMGKIRFCRSMLDSLDGKQRARYDAIVRNNPSQKVFYKGWINHRIGNVDRKKCDLEA